MAPKDLTKHQLSSRLGYEEITPAFLLKFKNKLAGVRDSEPEYDEYDEYEPGDSGRPPIPRRPPIPQRPSDDPGSADEADKDEDGAGQLDEEDADDERPQVVVLREGKHLSAREAENERRREKGLPPLDDSEPGVSQTGKITAEDTKTGSLQPSQSVSIGTKKSNTKMSAAKRKAMAISHDDDGPAEGPTKKKSKKRVKEKKLLSFGDDA
ncbi:hypothetical protein PUNSTDRAFT_47753 [Punctularia strigosozonata HHB-11173 SS5]|uniref:DUF4604 domain-containing protein n=1 Tax=Punctularia strigosozonata (strain HHB-11173) TaxID=741275 RepID=R7S2D8_PUNST|nr:uncharacterized protein PUNSTDRAFT_47753 [Punctularia strigosozonata HHB-11173 SS5]EIN03947.1 hypothetical protein PUNSTDRAFT_47753 [Punctularia strigosozonata HHB-11173 SS5]